MISSEKYARMEYERRFLLSQMEDEVRTLQRRVILDNYIVGTNLRLRQVENDEGDTIYKLTKKSRILPGSAQITTIYLSLEEYQLLSKLRAVVVNKVRFLMPHDDLTIAVDIYGTETDELWMAEVEFETNERMNNFSMPLPYQIEITGDDEFTGFALANRFGIENRRF
ncbi:MAG: hypothetical protein JSU01_11150 [Bacteroidetes bacterium]|nr:hypothetical protein [Bacteroidota bacterium]